MQRTSSLALGLALALLVLPVWGQEKGNPYLKDGKLTALLEISDLQGGVVGFTGTKWSVAQSGDFAVARAVGNKTDVQRKGELSRKELEALAKELERYDLATLKSATEGKPAANPHTVNIKFGKVDATLTLPAGSALPKPDRSTVPGRFAGIADAVKKATTDKKNPEPKEKGKKDKDKEKPKENPEPREKSKKEKDKD